MSGRITELFNNNVFTDAEMKARLPKKVYNEVKACKLDKGSADIVAQAVRDWAIEKGATHFTHVLNHWQCLLQRSMTPSFRFQMKMVRS